MSERTNERTNNRLLTNPNVRWSLFVSPGLDLEAADADVM